jgi:spore coat polysaccharide biosynthesis protein SpsF (cytidylyltransferase family)
LSKYNGVIKMIITLIQARMKSTRLPNKCIKKMAGELMTAYTIEAAKASKLNHFTGLIFPDCDKKVFFDLFFDKCFCYASKAKEEDVLTRYYEAFKYINKTTKENINNIVRITSDCPMLAFYPKVIDEVIQKHLLNNADYTHNRGAYSFPSGLDVEVMKSSTLEYINSIAKTKEDREHVTTFIKNNSKQFKICEVHSVFNFDYKWSVDTLEDFKRVEDIIKILKIRREYGK